MTGATRKRRGRPPKAAPTPAAPPPAPKAEAAPHQPIRAADHDVWMYREYDARLFKAGEIIPDDYVDSPAKVSRNGDR